MREFVEQDLARQRLFEFIVYQPSHWPRPITRIETVLCQPLASGLIQTHDDAFLGKLAVQLGNKFVDDTFDYLDIQCLECHPRIKSISKLWCERPFDDTFSLALCLSLIAKSNTARRQLASAGIGRHYQNDI